MQQIVHTLRTGGDKNFDDISRVVPWLEVSAVLGIDLEAEQIANPRAFKSHLSWDDMPRGGKYINVARDPADAAVSIFRFFEGWLLEPGAMTVDQFVQATFLASRDYYNHLKSWWNRRNDKDVLFLFYEEMLLDPETMIRTIARFIGVKLDKLLLEITLENSSKKFMLQHQDRFDEGMLRKHGEEIACLPPGSTSVKVTSGSTKAELGDETIEQLQQAWRDEIAGPFGFESYEEMIDVYSPY